MRFINYTAIASDIVDMLEKKRDDYGDPKNTIGRFGMLGIAVRLSDKIERLINLVENNQEANFESIEDTLMDIGGYAMLGLELMDEKD